MLCAGQELALGHCLVAAEPYPSVVLWVIRRDDDPFFFIRKKHNSSMSPAFELVQEPRSPALAAFSALFGYQGNLYFSEAPLPRI